MEELINMTLIATIMVPIMVPVTIKKLLRSHH